MEANVVFFSRRFSCSLLSSSSSFQNSSRRRREQACLRLRRFRERQSRRKAILESSRHPKRRSCERYHLSTRKSSSRPPLIFTQTHTHFKIPSPERKKKLGTAKSSSTRHDYSFTLSCRVAPCRVVPFQHAI